MTGDSGDLNEISFNLGPDKRTSPVAEAESWEHIARDLFNILDEIDTADDIAKGDEGFYRNLVRRHVRARFKYATTDGYRVSFNVKSNDDKTEGQSD